MSKQEIERLESELLPYFNTIKQQQNAIKEKLKPHANGKNLKGDELVGWLGEIYCKLLIDGILEKNDALQYDLTKNGERISVKTRKGRAKGWNRTSFVSNSKGGNPPTHLMFVHLNDDYSIDRIWCFPWEIVSNSNRFKKHRRGDYIKVSDTKDNDYICYQPVRQQPVKHCKVEDEEAEIKSLRQLVQKIGSHRVDERDTTSIIREMREKSYDL